MELANHRGQEMNYELERIKLSAKCNHNNQPIAWPKQVEPRILCVVGESLGKDELAAINDPGILDKYFVGAAGHLLNKLLNESNLIRASMHITNVVKVYIPSVTDKEAYLNSVGLSIEDFLPLLTAELQKVQPSAILATGAIAMQAITGKTGITKWRGSLLDCVLEGVDCMVVPTFHPSYLQRGQMKYYPYVRNDIKQFAQVGYGFREPEPSFIPLIDPSLTEALDYLSDIYLNSTHTCFDIETVGAEKITCIGWTKDENNCISIPFRYKGLKNRWSEPEQIMLCHAMREVYGKAGLVKIGQNMHYDMHFLQPLFGFPAEPLFDTMYAHSLIHVDAKHDLGFLTSVYTDLPYHKDENKDWEAKSIPHDEALWGYNAKDVIATHRVYIKLKKDLEEYGLYDFFTGYVMPFRRVLFEMEHRGLRVDLKLREEWQDFVRDEELPVALEILEKMAGEPLNPNSSPQVGKYIEEKLKIKVRRTAKGNYTVKEEVLEAMIARNPKHRELLKQILCTRVLKSKDLGTYLTAPLSADGRMRTGFGTTITGRLTSKANHKGEGTNLQNQPKKFRQMYLPEKGHVFLEPDLSQAEALEMAFLMRNEELKKRMLGGEKIHKIVGEWIYGKPGDKLTDEEYLTSKRCVHGCVDDLTEVLTPNGWLPIGQSQGRKIAQWDAKTWNITFNKPIILRSFNYDGPMVQLTQGYFNQCLSPAHKMPHWQVKYGRQRKEVHGPTRDILAAQFSHRRNSYKLPLSGTFQGTGVISSWDARLLVAVQADCSVRPYGAIEANFVKDRKIIRLVQILNALGVDYTTYPYKHNRKSAKSFYIPPQPKTKRLMSYLDKRKQFQWKLLHDTSHVSATAFLEELSFWDGRQNSEDSWQYYTTSLQNAEFVSTLAHLTNKRGIIARRQNYWEEQRTKDLFTVSISNYPLGDLTEMVTGKTRTSDKIFCPTTNTGYFLIRRKGRISITGNSNYDMGEQKFATVIGKPVKDAREFREHYHRVVPTLKRYHLEVQNKLNDTRRLVTPYGRIRVFTGRLDDEAFRSGYAQIPQSTVVDTINLGTLGLWLCKPDEVYIATQVHDSILISTPPELVEELSELIKLHLETLREHEVEGDMLTIPVDIGKTKENWYGH